MQDIWCEVIGCNAPVNWLLVYRPNASCEDYLCETCWQRLNQCQPEKASSYVALTDLCALVDSSLLTPHQDNIRATPCA